MDTSSVQTRAQSLLGQQRKASVAEELPPLKKISHVNQASFMLGAFCCQPTQSISFLEIPVAQIGSIFSIGKRLGDEGDQTVLLATCPHKKSFAIKEIEPPRTPNNDCTDLREESKEILTHLKSINDIHIMKFYAEYVKQDLSNASKETQQLPCSVRYLVCEYIQGFDLVEVFQNTYAITDNTIHYIMNQFFKINEALTQYKIIHQDLHMGNVMYCSQTHVLKVIDFGKSYIWKKSSSSIEIDKQKVRLFHSLSIAIASQCAHRRIAEMRQREMNTEELDRWIEFESDRFQNFVENPSVANKKLGFGLPTNGYNELEIYQEHQKCKRLLSKTATRIMVWSNILSRILNYNDMFESYSNYFTIEKFLRFKESLPPSNYQDLHQLYCATRGIES